MFEWFGVLVSEFGREVAMVTALGYGAYKFKRLKAIAGVVVGGIGTAATIGAMLIGTIVVGSAAGWVSLDIWQAIGDIVGGAQTAWDIAGEEVLSLLGGLA